jgi:hypothetical protein
MAEQCAVCGAEFATKTELDEHLQVCGIEILEVPEGRTDEDPHHHGDR